VTSIIEIAPDVFRICTFVPEVNLQFNQFLVRDEQPLLFHTGMKALFPAVRDAVATLLDPASLRWIGFSHFEVDECGSLNEWLKAAPRAQAVAGVVGSLVNLADFADRPARTLQADETFSTGRLRYRYRPTPHLPHGWDAGVLFEETQRVLFCSDLFTHNGDVEPITEGDILGRARQSSSRPSNGQARCRIIVATSRQASSRHHGGLSISFITPSSSIRALAASPVKELPCMVASVRGLRAARPSSSGRVFAV
jgi:hypothetical protein